MMIRVVCCLMLLGLAVGCRQVPVTGVDPPTEPAISVQTSPQPTTLLDLTQVPPVEVPLDTATPTLVIDTPTPFETETAPAPTTVAPKPTGPVLPLTRQQAENFTYRLYYTLETEITLQNGEFEYQNPASDPPVFMHTYLHPVDAYGHINPDDASDAVVILVTNTGGSGQFYDLVALANHEGTPIQVAEAHLGDRQGINSLTITDRMITLDFVTHDDDDPFCCPTQRVRREYIWVGPDLVVVSEEILGVVTPAPEVTPSPTGTLTPDGTPSPDVSPSPDGTPSPEATPTLDGYPAPDGTQTPTVAPT